MEPWRREISFGASINEVKADLAKLFPDADIRVTEGIKEYGGTSTVALDVPSNFCSDLGLYFSFDKADKLAKVAYSATRCSYRDGPKSRFIALYGEPTACYEQTIVGTAPHEPVEVRCLWIDREDDLIVELKTWTSAVDLDGGPLNAYFLPLSGQTFDIATQE